MNANTELAFHILAAVDMVKRADTRHGREYARMLSDPAAFSSDSRRILEFLNTQARSGQSSMGEIFKGREMRSLGQSLLSYPEIYAATPMTPMRAADRIQDIKTMTSGRHLALPHEYVIPAGVNAEVTGRINPPNSGSIFRGGDILPDQVQFFSQHPDVAANYAMGRRGDVTSGRTNRQLHPQQRPFNAYKADSFDTLRTQSTGGPEGPAAVNVNREIPAARYPGSKSMVQTFGSVNPSYETPAHVSPTNTPKWLGQYGARHVRAADGMPALALSRVSGASIPKAFGPHLIQSPSFGTRVLSGLKNIRKFLRL